MPFSPSNSSRRDFLASELPGVAVENRIFWKGSRERFGRRWAGAIGLLVAVAALDCLITSEISLSILYLLPVCLGAWYAGTVSGVLMSVLAALAWYIAEKLTGLHFYSAIGLFWQSFSRFLFSVVATLLVSRVRVLTSNLEALVRTRTAALQSEVMRRRELEKEAAEITEREQERIAHELHDDLAAYLAGISFRAKSLAESLEQREVPEKNEASQLILLVDRATDQVRSLAQMLAPVDSAEMGLASALSSLSREAETVFQITCTLDLPDPLPPLSREQCAQLYRIAQEAVRNAVRHSQAELVEISVVHLKHRLQLNIRCDGKPWRAPPQPSAGLGLKIMRHRTEKMGGTLWIEPLASGGALVRCEVPMIVSQQDGPKCKDGGRITDAQTDSCSGSG